MQFFFSLSLPLPFLPASSFTSFLPFFVLLSFLHSKVILIQRQVGCKHKWRKMTQSFELYRKQKDFFLFGPLDRSGLPSREGCIGKYSGACSRACWWVLWSLVSSAVDRDMDLVISDRYSLPSRESITLRHNYPEPLLPTHTWNIFSKCEFCFPSLWPSAWQLVALPTVSLA